MKVTVEVSVRSDSDKPNIRVHSALYGGEFVEIEIKGERYKVNAREMISAIERCEMGLNSKY
jgi:hypothetical protein